MKQVTPRVRRLFSIAYPQDLVIPPHSFTAPNLANELVARRRSFGGFSESLPAPGYLGCSAPGGYVRRHNPWSDFTNVPLSQNRPFANFPTDYTRLPTVSYVVPDLNDDMHDGTVQQADTGYRATWRLMSAGRRATIVC